MNNIVDVVLNGEALGVVFGNSVSTAEDVNSDPLVKQVEPGLQHFITLSRIGRSLLGIHMSILRHLDLQSFVTFDQ